MNLEQIEYIIEVTKAGSLSKAANHLDITIPAISQSISNLEAELGIKLFHRSHLGASPTAEGQNIIDIANSVLSQIQLLKKAAMEYSNPQTNELRIASSPGLTSLIVDTLVNIKEDYPQLKLSITEKTISEIEADFQSNHIDVAIMILREELMQKRNLLKGLLLEGNLLLVVSKRSPFVLEKSITIEDLRQLPLVLYKDEILQKSIDEFERTYGSLNILFWTNHSETIIKLVSEGFASTIAMDLSFERSLIMQIANLAYVDLEVSCWESFHVGWVCLRDNHLTEPSKVFLTRLEHDLRKK
ncbi:LysR family transcriptional regulator [Neobacillus sp. MER 74]|uniref:LysR family transcriptional regulator n=1 Tax=Neobacillus sp. MER 74 TaxID=2939566 RepID=UPI002041BF39|nr:LysR family transcriptional regulator [Neobacillus sp. MER 74]MCM3113741.1 LysR family transcriptional regulator [Neobacillus sp. MER 74]